MHELYSTAQALEIREAIRRVDEAITTAPTSSTQAALTEPAT
jgi:hypothetical protein